ncbi:MAG: hypothetical protein AB8B49_05500 [Nitratireductor sp.]
MLESILYFVLGFLCSALIALMISPAIWNRAVILTRKRIESSIPLSLNEIQADKDQLRAEFAMSTRRLEHSVEELKETAAHQVIEINRKRDELAKISNDSEEKILQVEELEARASELRETLNTREDALVSISSENERVKIELEDKALKLDTLNSTLMEAQNDRDSSRIELVAKQTAMDELADKLTTGENVDKTLAKQIKSLNTQLSAAQAKLDTGKQRLDKLRSTNEALELKVQTRENDISKIRRSELNDNQKLTQANEELTSEKARNTELEAKLAASSLRMEALLEDASNENVQKAMKSFNEDRDSLKRNLKEVTKERNKLQKELKARSVAFDSDWETERTENATLRERINDLAAEVTAMTASLEGPNSPINDILDKAPKKRVKKNASNSEVVETLADRIKALQEAARIKEA